MGKNNISENKQELTILCNTVRDLATRQEYRECEPLITNAMMKYPHAPEPHNLIGILLEKEGDHLAAMKHFRAAWALDPTYVPARYNLDIFGSFYSDKQCAFDESDCPKEPKKDLYKTVCDKDGIGHIVRKD